MYISNIYIKQIIIISKYIKIYNKFDIIKLNEYIFFLESINQSIIITQMITF